MLATGIDVKADDAWPFLDQECLAANIYHEARGEPLDGQFAVGQVTLNRAKSKRFPDSVCEVVKQKHQFSWYWDGASDLPKDKEAWELANVVAQNLLSGESVIYDYSYGALYYWNPHKAKYSPWMDKVALVVIHGNHAFFD